MENGNRGKIIINRILRDVKETFGAGVAFLIYYLIIHSIFNAFCPFLVTTGLPCPGCGLTRAALYLLQGQPGRAAHINPSIFLLLGFAMYCGYFRYIKGSPVRGIKGGPCGTDSRDSDPVRRPHVSLFPGTGSLCIPGQ